jgi:tetratricopeptide (TPR) repeat protein
MPVRMTSLLAAIVAMSPPVWALDTDSLKLIADEIPYPQMQFGISVGLSADNVLLSSREDPRALLDEAQKRLAEDPNDPEAHSKRGLALYLLREDGAHEEFARAAELWRPIVQQQPDNLEARVGLLRALWETDERQNTAAQVKELADQHPELWWPHFALGQQTADALFGLLGVGYLGSIPPPDFNDPQAVADWGKHFPQEHVAGMAEAIRNAREDPEGFRSLAEKLADEALAHLDKAAKAAPEEIAPAVLTFLVHWQLGMLKGVAEGGLTPGIYDAAHDELLKLAEAHPEIPRLRLFANFQQVLGAMVRGQVTDFLGVWDQFTPEDQQRLTADEEATRRILATPDGQASDTYELAALYSLLHGKLDEGIETLRKSTEQDPTSGERWEAYVGVLTQTNDVGAVQAAIGEALKHTDDGTLRCALAKVYQKQGDLAKADAELEAAIALNDDRATFARVMLGVLRLKSGNVEGAIPPLQAASAQWREDGLCETALALALALSGKQPEAAAHIAKAAELSPANRLVARAVDIIGK